MRSRSAFVALLLPFTLSAQRPDTTMIPVELVRALVGFSEFGGGGRDPQIVVGRVAEPSLAAVVPKGARVLGGVAYPGRRFSGSTTVLAMSERPDSALKLVARGLEGVGYKAAPMFESRMMERGGFAFSSSVVGMGGMSGSMTSYCGDSTSMVASVSEDGNRGTVIRLMSSGVRNTMCDPEMASRMQGRSRMEELEMPTLRPPAGVTGRPRGSSGSEDSRTTEAALQGSLSAGELLDHFAPQLREQGWTLVDRATNGDLSVQTAKRTDKNGELVYLAVSDVRFGPREHDVTLRVWKESRYR